MSGCSCSRSCFRRCFCCCGQGQLGMGSTNSSWRLQHLLPVGAAPAALAVAAVTCKKRLRARTGSSCSSTDSCASCSERRDCAGGLPQRPSLLVESSAALPAGTSVGDASTLVQKQTPRELPQQLLRLGSIGRLGDRCLLEHRGRPAIVTEVAETHCAVSVLDPSLQSVLDQCWPNLADFAVEMRLAEIGSRVVVQGLKGKRTQWCNSLVGTVVAHPTKGHPCFIRKAGSEQPLLVLCVRLDDPPPEGQKQVLMEVRFLVPVESASNMLQGD
eukprot:TRINITY_DN36548_c0_g1_i1.p1 TRINITY_DN36548_c0_g1~~TRINITY_DN36548_c0_g1_i1.p1  ORF type:complete len:272 (+),score=54.63 TRINITY_DN36548_c0_g1_i1:104-919(+)